MLIKILEPPFPFNFVKFRVQFMCNRGRNNGQYGYYRRFLGLKIDAMNGYRLQNTLWTDLSLTVNQDVI